MLLDLVLLLAGLALLVWAADQFVLGSSRLAAILALPPVVVGAVIMGFGTSAPEMLVSAIAASGGDRALGVGNIVGSNVANLSLVLGTAAFVTTMAIPDSAFRREIPLSIGASLVFAVLVADGDIARWEGALLAAGLLSVVAYLIASGGPDLDDDEDPSELDTGPEIGRTLAGLVGTVLGAQLVVMSATDLAEAWGISGGFVGFSLVALGTSLPELVTTVASARRGETQLIVGNLFGSNIFNAFAVGGAMGLVGPGLVDDPTLTGTGLVLMLGVAALSFALGWRDRSIARPNGVVLLAAYVACTAVLGLNSEDESAGGPSDELAGVSVEAPEAA